MHPIDDGSLNPSNANDAVVQRALQHGLDEVVGGDTPPDVRAGVLAELARRDVPAANSDQIAAPPQRRWLTAALVLLGVSAVVAVVLTRQNPGGARDRGLPDRAGATDPHDNNSNNNPGDPNSHIAAEQDGGTVSNTSGPNTSGWVPPVHPHAVELANLAEFRTRISELTAVEFVPCCATYGKGLRLSLGIQPAHHDWERDPATIQRWKDALLAAPEGQRPTRGINDYRAHARFWVTDPDAAAANDASGSKPADERGRYILAAIDDRRDLRVSGAGTLQLPAALQTEWEQRVAAHERVARLKKGVVFAGAELAELDVKINLIRAYGLLPEHISQMAHFKHRLTLDLSFSPGIDQGAMQALCDLLAQRRESSQGWGSVNTLIAPRGMLWGKGQFPTLSDLGPLFEVRLDHSTFTGDPADSVPEYPLGRLVQRLSLQDAELSTEWLQALVELTQLRTFDASRSKGLDPRVIPLLAAMPNLKDLDLAYAGGLKEADFRPLAALPLENLDLRQLPIDAESFRALCKCVRLEHLALGGTPPADAVDHLLMLPRLRTVVLTEPPADLSRLTALPLLRRIEFTNRMWAPQIQEIRKAFEATGSNIELVFHSNW